MKPLEFYKNVMQPEIEDLFERMYVVIKDKPEADALYNGWQVWFSNIIENPDILFIGNNPNSVKNDPDFEPHDSFDYLEDKNAWGLKDSTLEVFSESQISNIFDLTKCVKTNYYYLATSYGRNIDVLRGLLESNESTKNLVDEFNQKSKLWTRQIIDILNPKYIFCEGFSAFDLVIKYALEENYLRDKSLDVLVYQSEKFPFKIIAYSRNVNSSIKNQELLIETLKKLK